MASKKSKAKVTKNAQGNDIVAAVRPHLFYLLIIVVIFVSFIIINSR